MIHFSDCTEEIREHYGCICESSGEIRCLVNSSNKRRKGEKLAWIERASLWFFGDPLVLLQ